MYHLEVLLARAGTGDPAAEADLRRHLNGTLPVIVRRTLRTRKAGGVLSRWALAEAERLGDPGWERSAPVPARLVRRVVRRLGERVLDDLRRGRALAAPLRETLRT